MNATGECEALIEAVLALSRVGRRDIENEVFDPRELLENLSRSLALEGEVRFVGEGWTDFDMPTSAFRQAFQNLITNGFKFNDLPEKIVTVECRRRDETHVEMSVTDEGIGIEPAYHGKIFEVFQRLNPRENYEGTGIGLAIVKKAVDFLNGELTLESELGKGSRFIVVLPIERTS